MTVKIIEPGPKVDLSPDLDWRNALNVEVARPRGGYDDEPPDACFTFEYAMENKLDGIRKTWALGLTKNWLVGRNRHDKTKGVEKSSKKPFVSTCEGVPWLTGLRRPALAGTMLDGELVVDEREHGVVGATMVGHLESADPDKLKYVAFDILFCRGIDVRGKSWDERRHLLEEIVAMLAHPKIECSKVFPADRGIAKGWFEAGAEGVVLKPCSTPYLPGRGSKWWKYKASKTTDGFVVGVSEASDGGSPKNGVKPRKNGKASRFKMALMRDGKPVEIGWCGDLPEDAVEEGFKNPSKFFGRVIEMKMSGWDGRFGGWLRFVRWREDKQPRDCDWESQVGGLKVQEAEA